MTHRRTLTTVLLAGAATLLLSLLVAGTAAAAKSQPCWKQLINDWYDGRIDRTYPARCYRRAIEELPEDVDAYSSAREDINRALLAAIRDNGGRPLAPNAPVEPLPGTGREVPSVEPEDDESAEEAAGGAGNDEGPISFFRPSNADSIPIPLLVLGGLALLLLVAAGGSFAARRIQARRVRPAPPDG